jgi:hypothetical protein
MPTYKRSISLDHLRGNPGPSFAIRKVWSATREKVISLGKSPDMAVELAFRFQQGIG